MTLVPDVQVVEAVEWLTRHGAPHVTWLIAALMVQRERQRWHHEVARPLMALDEQLGDVPGLPGWRYFRHGLGCCLHAPDGEALDVDFRDAGSAMIDVWFFAARVESVKDAERWLAESRLWRWRSSREAIVDGCDELVELGAAAYWPAGRRSNLIVLAPELEARAPAVARDLAWPASRAHWLAALEPGGESTHLASHRAWLVARLAASPRAGDLLDLAIAGTTPDEAIALCRPFLARTDRAAGRAIELLRARPDVPPTADVIALLRRLSLADDHPFVALQACAYLIERDIERPFALARFDAWSRVAKVDGHDGNPTLSDFAIFALRELPERALDAVRRTLRDGVPHCVWRLGGLLAAIDRRWCHRELIAALGGPWQLSQSYLAAALRCSSGELARRRADAVPVPPAAPDGGYTIDQLIHASADDGMRHMVDGWRDLAATLRTRYPDDWPD